MVTVIPNHMETGLDPIIQSQMTGNQSALEVRTESSRLRKNNPRIPILVTAKARVGLIFPYFRYPATFNDIQAAKATVEILNWEEIFTIRTG
jgi:2-keto-3-deoxy-galactonokinase